MSRVLSIDLREPERLLVLHGQARRAGFVGNSEADRLQFFAAAAHASTHGRTNPPGLFATVVRKGLWRHLTLGDEGFAQKAIRSLDLAPASSPPRRAEPLNNRPDESPEMVRALIAKSLGLKGDARDWSRSQEQSRGACPFVASARVY